MTDPSSFTSGREAERLSALHEYEILDTPAEPALSDLAHLAAWACRTPISMVSFVDRDRVWLKAAIGLEIREIPRPMAFCSVAITKPDLFCVRDLARDRRFRENPSVARANGFRFYAGVPLCTAEGLPLGVLCVMDYRPRVLKPVQVDALRSLGRQVMITLESRRNLRRLERSLHDHERVELALRETEAKYRSIFENVVEGIYLSSPDGQYLSANPMLARIYGYASPEELIAAIGDIGHQVYVDPARREEFVRLMKEQGNVSRFESRVYRRDGSIIWVAENAREVRDPSGRLLHYEGTVEDITERKRAEQAVHDSELLYHSLVDCLPQNIFRKDRSGRFTFVNPSFCQTLKRTPEEILGRTDSDFFPPALSAKYRADDQRVMESRQTVDVVEEHVKPDGGKLYVHVLKTALCDASGQVIGVQGIFWDVTERKRMEEAIAHERDLVQALLDSIPDSIYFKDTQSRFVRCSRLMALKFGASDPWEVVGRTDFDFFGEAHAKAAFEDERRILRTGQPIVGVKEVETWPDGRETWALTTKMPLRDSAGKLIGTFGVSKDITELVAAEQELKKARDTALELMRLKGEFLANMSHELRTPMNAIVGMTDLLLGTELTPDQRECSVTIRESAEALLGLINDILDLSRLEARRLSLSREPFDLHDVLEGTLEFLAESAHAKGLELVGVLAPDLPPGGIGDAGRLRQVLTNLLGNAIKFTERGHVILRAGVVSSTDDAALIRVEIQDTGIGIPPEAQGHIFEAFRQADGSTTRKYGGTGLGLTISRQIVELMGGELGVVSTPGGGSTFGFTAGIGLPANSAARVSPAHTLLRGKRILVVDDQPVHRGALADLCRQWDMTAAEAGSGPEALAELARSQVGGEAYDLALIDILMPDMDGLTLAEQIRARPELGRTRIVMLTTLGNRLDVASMRTSGISASILKPPRRRRLYDTLVKVTTASTPTGAHEHRQLAPLHRAAEPALANEQQPSVRILLAEDNVLNQRLALRQLRHMGFSADVAANGREVLEAVERRPYDVLLLDCQMPEMDGYEAARAIRKQEVLVAGQSGTLRPPLRIIAMTANAMEGDRDRCLASGMDDYITKPVLMSDLAAALERARIYLAAEEPQPPSPPPSSPHALPADDEPTLDATTLRSLRQLNAPGETDTVREMIDLFLQTATTLRDQIVAAAQAQDLAALRSAAHGLKGNAGGLGAKRLARLCASMEKGAREGNADAAFQWLEAVQDEFTRVETALLVERDAS